MDRMAVNQTLVNGRRVSAPKFGYQYPVMASNPSRYQTTEGYFVVNVRSMLAESLTTVLFIAKVSNLTTKRRDVCLVSS